MQSVRIPAYADEMRQWWFWETDELIVMLGGLVTGLLLDYMLTGTVLGFFLSVTFKKYKTGLNRGALIHILYWFGVFNMKSMWCKNAYQRFWIK